jgi:hypothetical protein
MSRLLYEYGWTVVDTYSSYRIIDILPHASIEDIIQFIHDKKGISLATYHIEIIHRETTRRFNMKWHIDDHVLVRRKKKDEIVAKHEIVLSKQVKLVPRTECPPEFSILYYLSEPNEFKGGELEFVNQVVAPQKHMIVFFHSRKIHRVRQVEWGTRKIILYKFYKD